MTDIKPITPETILAANLPQMNVTPEKGEQTYYSNPFVPGETNMELRPAALQALIQADCTQQTV